MRKIFAVKPGNKSVVLALIFLFLFLSCTVLESCTRIPPENTSGLVAWSGAYPSAFLQTGSYPLWFLLTDNGPVHIEAIEDIICTSAPQSIPPAPQSVPPALIPWPYALHICSLSETGGEITAAVNRGGFIKLALYNAPQSIPFAPQSVPLAPPGSLALYYFPGGDFWQQYTVSGFVYYEGQPAAVLYLDDRFLTLDISPPNPRAWSFNMNSNIPFPLDIPSLQLFPEKEGWNIDVLRPAAGGLIYYRAAIRSGPRQSVRMMRTSDLNLGGEEISAAVFFDSAPRRMEFFHPSLPLLPEGFVYTGIGRTAGSLFAAWEEQADFSIGAAGFVVIKEY